MRRVAMWIVAGTAGAAALLLAGVAGGAEEKVKPGESVHVYDDGSFADEHGKVVFSHLEHKELFGQEKFDCKPCHMTKPPLFEMKKKEGAPEVRVTMKEMTEGKSCGGCHDGKTTINGKVAVSVADPESCGHCHKK